LINILDNFSIQLVFIWYLLPLLNNASSNYY